MALYLFVSAAYSLINLINSTDKASTTLAITSRPGFASLAQYHLRASNQFLLRTQATHASRFFGSWAFVTDDLLPCVRKFMIYCMAKLTRKQIKELAKSIIASNPRGIRFSSLVYQILQQNPETPEATIRRNVRNLEEQFPQEVRKPSRTLYTPIGTKEIDTVSAGSTEQIAPTTGVKVEPFAELLKNNLDEVTEVASLGGGLQSKWGTPDVVGTYKKLPGNVIELPVEIASPEIEIDPPELKIECMRPWWLVFTIGVITAGELVLLIGMYSGDGNVWLRWLDTNTAVTTSGLDTPKTLTQVGSPTAALPIASADSQPTDGEPPTAALPIASAGSQPTDGEPPTAALPIASADSQPTDGEPPTAALPIASADSQPTDSGSPTAALPISSADSQPTDGESPTAALPIASADSQPTGREPPTAALPIASADSQPTDGEPPTAALPIASADSQPTDGEPPTAALPIASADSQPTDSAPPTAALPIASADSQPTDSGPPTAALPIASADSQPIDGEPPTAALPIASADSQPTDGEPPTAALPIASADSQPTDGEPPTAALPIASADSQQTDGEPPTAALPIASADTHSNQLAEPNKPVMQAEPAPATVTSSPPSQPSQVASVQAGTAPGSGPQSLSAQRGTAVRHLDAEEIATLINRGTDSLKSGDLVSARLLLRRAAEAGSASAALMLGTTFDPLVIQQLGAIGVVPDVAQARQWYEKAVELGSDAASQRLAQLPLNGQ